MLFDSSRGTVSTPIIGVIPLRLGAGLTLVYMHAWHHALAAWLHLWNQTPWEVVGTLEAAGFPMPKVLAVTAAVIAAFTGVSWIVGFATPFTSFLFLPVALGALLVANRTGQSFAAESCILYFLTALTLIASGSGWLSVDALIKLINNWKKKPSSYL